ncbi:protein GLUTAMINE DUMPER 5-like [Argentina anserina]|uniref:protein GLUTAMINE DUMPER 5-like n=1 Tax=Argentina anserina TaxID=57926 RepID=UPI0021768BC3|nr:protein GLUTAMINE DUMPER 5-like [Potentilla anserina]
MAPTGSPWKYPIPFLLGGLVTMTILVASALLILACSYWKRNGEGSSAVRDVEPGGESVKVFKDKVLVIMAGNEHATYLATPIPICPRKDTSFEEESEMIAEDHHKEEDSEILKGAAPSTE